MADFSALIAQIEAYVKQNGNNDITGNGLQDILVAMVGAIGGALNDAVSDLESADTTLTNAIGEEELARQGADNTLGGRITAEEEARAGADTGLQNQINGINGKIPDTASGTNKLADKAFVQGLVDALTASIAAINDKIPSEASSSNKLADKAFVQALTTALQNALNTLNGKVPAAATSENQLADKAFVTSLTTALQNAINAINTNIGNGFVYAGVATPSGTPVSGKVAYLTAQAGTYTNYGDLVVPAGISVIKYDGTNWSQEQIISMETIYRNPLMGLYDCDTSGSTAAKTVTAVGYILPTNGGAMKVRMANHTTVDNVTLNINGTGAKDLYYKGKAAGINNTWGDGAVLNVIYDSTNDRYLAYNANAGTGDGVFDVSEYTGDDYARLEDAIADIPVSEQHGGMEMRFVRSSDNKYVQYFLSKNEWSIDPNDWEKLNLEEEVRTALDINIPFYSNNLYYNLSSATVGSTITRVLTLGANYEYAEIDCEEGDKFYIYTLSTNATAKSYAILSENGEVLAVQQASSNKGFDVTIPANGKTLVVNSAVNVKAKIIKKYGATKQLANEYDNQKVHEKDSFFVNIPFVSQNQYVNLTNATSGEIVSLSYASAPGYGYVILDVEEWNTVQFTTSTNSASAKAYAFLDKDNRCIFVSQSAVTDKTVVIPPKCVKMIINTKITASTYVKTYDYTFTKKTKDIADNNNSFISRMVEQSAVLITGGYVNLQNATVGSIFSDFSDNVLAFSGYGYFIHHFADNYTLKIKTSGNTASAKSYAVITNDFIVREIVQAAGTYTINVQAGDYVIVNTSISSYSIDIDGEWIGCAKNGKYQNFEVDTLSVKDINLREKNAKLQFDDIEVQRAKSNVLVLQLNKNVPIEGQCISVDHLNDAVLGESATMDEIQAKFVPFLYWNQQKIGTIILFDESTGKPFFYDKNGVKKYLTVE